MRCAKEEEEEDEEERQWDGGGCREETGRLVSHLCVCVGLCGGAVHHRLANGILET